MEYSHNPSIQSQLSRSVLCLMAIGSGLVVANIYYNQPLLGLIARDFGRSEAAVSSVPMITQIGYAAGLLLIIPMGDMFKRKRIILIDFLFIILSLLAFAFSRSLTMMIAAGFLIGLTSVIPQMFVPMAAQLSLPEERAKNVGMVMSGLLIGVLASRVFSGILAEYFGWRMVFMIAAGIMFLLSLFVVALLPEIQPAFSGTYRQLMMSIGTYLKKLPDLQLASLRGALVFGSFSILWTTLVFRLEQPPFFAGSNVAGSLGLIGIAGAVAAMFAGRLANRVNPNAIITGSVCFMLLSWLIFGVAGATYAGLIIGIIILDMGTQVAHISNQAIIFSSHPEATNRINTVYMVSYFIGGAFGTWVGGRAWGAFGWTGTVVAGALFIVACLAVHLFYNSDLSKNGNVI